MLGLYSREELNHIVVTELIRREFLARLYDDDSKRADDEDCNAQEMTKGIILHLVKIRSILCPKASTMTFKDAEALFRKAYCEAYSKITNVETPEDNGWWPDFMEKADHAYTKGIIKHLASLNAQYDVQWQREMMLHFKEANEGQ
jgi:hypothetical protein